MTDAYAPPGWPAEVRPAGAPDWQQSAAAWLFDQCPADYRAYEVLRRHPIVLARFAAGQLEASVAAARHGLATSRSELRDVADDVLIEAVLAAYDREGRRLAAALRATRLIEQALSGKTFIPRL